MLSLGTWERFRGCHVDIHSVRTNNGWGRSLAQPLPPPREVDLLPFAQCVELLDAPLCGGVRTGQPETMG